MLVTGEDAADMESFASRCSSIIYDSEVGAEMAAFFSDRLHLLLPCGYDELRYTLQPFPRRALPACVRGEPAYTLFADFSRVAHDVGTIRHIATGAWYYVAYGRFRFKDARSQKKKKEPGVALIPIDILHKPQSIFYVPLSQVVNACQDSLHDTAAITFPNIWRPPDQTPTLELVHAASSIVQALQREVISLDDLSWQQLEDVVAELLHGRGLDVQLTRRTADGGRDVIARGELIPGEPSVLAVEVKHKTVVTLPDVRNTLWANRGFPLVMVATSGRFSAGVVREKSAPENHFRLLLKDRIALTQWVREYKSSR